MCSRPPRQLRTESGPLRGPTEIRSPVSMKALQSRCRSHAKQMRWNPTALRIPDCATVRSRTSPTELPYEYDCGVGVIPSTEDRCAPNCSTQEEEAVARRASRLLLPEHSDAKCTVPFGIWYNVLSCRSPRSEFWEIVIDSSQRTCPRAPLPEEDCRTDRRHRQSHPPRRRGPARRPQPTDPEPRANP